MAKTKTLRCLACKSEDVTVDAGTRAVIGPNCMQKIVGAPAARSTNGKTDGPTLNKNGKPRAKRGEGKKYAPSGFPRGWHFKIYYKHTDGKVYSRGKLVTDKKLMQKLVKAGK